MQSFYLPPGTLELVIVSGADAAKLLQGQLTCDVDAIADPGFARGALCNNKGRVLVTFILVRQEQDFYFVLNEGLSILLMQSLKKYLPFYKCEMRLSEGTVIGAVGHATASALAGTDALPEAGQCARLRDGWICNLDAEQQQYVMHRPTVTEHPAGLTPGSTTQWLISGLPSGQFPFTASDSEQYTPQELHLDRNGYVSFTKGCYTGQEIVARMHYRGKQKKLLHLIVTDSAVSPDEEVEILDGTGLTIGASFKTLNADGRSYILAHLPADLDDAIKGALKNKSGLEFDKRVF
ncbi:MAG TPA: hypothetical protein VGE69_08860 [Pseudomonadales bacterium]